MTKVDILITATDKATKVIERSLSRIKTQFAKLGKFRVPALAGAAAATAALTYAGKAAIDLEKQMSYVAKTTGLAGESLKNLSKGFVQLSRRMPMSAVDLAKIGQIAGQLGIQGRENILKFTETVAKMTVAFDMTAEDAATAMAKASAAFGLPVEKIENLASAINQLGNTTAASEREIIAAMYRIAPAAAQLGIAAEDAVALVDTLVAMGQAPEEAGTRLNRALIEMSSKLDKMAEQMGVTTEELKRRMDMGDALGVLLDYLNMLGQTESATQRLTMAEEVFGAVGAKAVLSLATNFNVLNKNLQTSRTAFEQGISLSKEYANATDNTAARLQILRNQLSAVAITIGEVVIPYIKQFADWVSRNQEPIQNLANTVARSIGFVLKTFADAVDGARLMYVDIKGALTMLKLTWGMQWEAMHLLLAKAWRAIVDKVEAGVNAAIEALNRLGEIVSKATGGRFGWHIATISLDKYKNKLGDVAELTKKVLEYEERLRAQHAAWMKEREALIAGWGKRREEAVAEATGGAAMGIPVGEATGGGAIEEASKRMSESIDSAARELERLQPSRPVVNKIGPVNIEVNVQEISEENVDKVADLLTDVFLRKLTEKTGFYVGV